MSCVWMLQRGHSGDDQSACKPRQNPSYGIPPKEQRGEENVKGEMEHDISGEHTPS